MSSIQEGCKLHPERCVIGHPFNPPHLIPLVEIVGGSKTSEDTIERAAQFYTSIGKRTVRLHKELSGHVANRLQAAVMREAYYLVGEGVPQRRRRRYGIVLGAGPAVGHHGAGPAQPPGGRRGRHGALLGPIHRADYRLVEGPRIA